MPSEHEKQLYIKFSLLLCFLSHGIIPNCFWANKVSLFKHATTTRLTFTLKLIYDHCDARWNSLSGCLFSGHINKKLSILLSTRSKARRLYQNLQPQFEVELYLIIHYKSIQDNFPNLVTRMPILVDKAIKKLLIKQIKLHASCWPCHIFPNMIN